MEDVKIRGPGSWTAAGSSTRRAGLADKTTVEELVARIAAKMWVPRYVRKL